MQTPVQPDPTQSAYSKYNQKFGATGPLMEEEWDAFLRRRRQLVDQIEGRQAAAAASGDPIGTDIAANTIQVGGEYSDGRPTAFGEAMRKPTQADLNDLFGAAQYYGIDNYKEIPPEHLKQIIEARRMDVRMQSLQAGDDMNPWAATGAEFLAALGVGSTHELIKVAQRIPFIGDALAATKTMQMLDQGLASLNEGVLSSMTEEEEKGSESTRFNIPLLGEVGLTGYRSAKGLGGMIGYTLPAEAAWAFAGRLGQLGGVARIATRMSPIARAAAQGGAAAWMLEGGGEDPYSERATKIAFGAGLAGAIATPLAQRLIASLGRMADRVSGSFGTRTFGGPEGFSPRANPETVDADWHFINDPPQIGPAGAPGGAGGPGGGLPPEGGGGGIPLFGGVGEAPAGIDPSIRMGAVGSAEPFVPGQPEPPTSMIGPERQLMSPREAGQTYQRNELRRLLEVSPLTGQGSTLAMNGARPAVNADPNLEVIALDGKKFKDVNDRLGRFFGDDVLKAFGQTIDGVVDAFGLPRRTFHPGGDEFFVVVPKGRGAEVGAEIEKQSQMTFTHEPVDGATQTVTGLRSYVAPTFDEASLQMGRNKRGTKIEVSAATTEAATLTKQAQIMESPILHEMAGQQRFDDTDVVRAVLATNPVGIGILRDVGDAGTIMRKLVAGQHRSIYGAQLQLMPHQFRIVKHPSGSMDMLVTTGQSITPKKVAQYEATGMMEGQLATTANGVEVEIVTPAASGGKAVVRPVQMMSMGEAAIPMTVNADELMPHTSVRGYEHAPKLYNDFRQYVENEMANEGTDFAWLDRETSTQLPRLLDRFLNEAGIENNVQRHGIEAYFNTRRVADFRSLAPDDAAHADAITEELSAVMASRPPRSIPVDDIAAAKGFVYIPAEDGVGGLLQDQLGNLRVQMADEEAAMQFLRTFNREVPDITPISDVPIEIMGASPHASNPGTTLDPVPEGGHDAAVASAERDLRRVLKHQADHHSAVSERVARDLAAPPAGTVPPPPPPPPASLGGADYPQIPRGERSLGAAMEEARRTRPADLYKVLQDLDSAWLNYGVPFRSFTLQIQNALHDMGIPEGKLWLHYSDVVTAKTVAHNEANPWHSELADITSNYREVFHRKGTVTKLMEIADFNQQMQEARKAGFTDREINTLSRHRDWYDRFFNYLTGDPSFNLDARRYVFGYMTRVRARQGMPGVVDPFADTDGMLPRGFEFVAEMARTGNLQFRQMDDRVLGTYLVRAAMFRKHIEAPYSRMVEAWDDPRIPEKLRNIVTDWLTTLKTGHNPGYDPAVQGARHFLNKMGVPVTDGEVAGMYNTLFSSMYRGQLGWRPDAIFRDSIQPFLSGTRIGFRPIAEAYTAFIRNPRARAEMWDRAIKGGWVEKGQQQVANADVFEGDVMTPEGESLLSPMMQARREMLAKVNDFVQDLIPRRLKQGLQGTIFDPLLGYTKLGELNRLISGEAGWQKASKAIAEYQFQMQEIAQQRQIPNADEMLVDLMDRHMNVLMRESGARFYPRPIRDQFKQLVETGDMEGAANLMANESANMQYRYGQLENPIGIRKAGFFGRMGMMYGTFTQQYIAGMREQFAPDVPVQDRVAMGMRHGAILGAIGLASAYTGWNFSKWAWHQSLTFAGGPLAQGAWHTIQAGTGALSEAFGQNPSPDQRMALSQWQRDGLGGVVGGAVGEVLPWGGGVRTLSNLAENTSSINPWEAAMRGLVTGERGLAPDMRQFFDAQAQTIITPPDIDAAIQGDSAARAKFPSADLLFLENLRHVPQQMRYQAYGSYRSGQPPFQGSSVINRPDPGYRVPVGSSAPGSGAQY
jgi:GGDEF domain-containing protein